MDAFVEMTGTGTASGPPDVVVLDLSVRATGSAVAKALGSADEAMTGIVEHARGQGIAATDLQTTGASVYPQHDRDGVRTLGYVATQSLRVRLRDREGVGPLISACSRIAGNALTIENIGLQIGDTAELTNQARAAAFADARTKAQQFADLAGRALGQVIFVADAPIGPGPVRYARMAAMAADSAGGMPVEMGEHSVSATVTVRWGWA